ncbi:MAG: hypothetical protein QOI68_5285, partial [Pseudonocardiales bacterium]|nr:hypothetical protein [Pseudonocardiales bacterium]
MRGRVSGERDEPVVRFDRVSKR